MEDWQKEIIITNLDKLINNTTCYATLLAALQASGVLNKDDIGDLNRLDSSHTAQSLKLYSVLQTRVNAFESLINSLKITNQSGALRILNGDTDNFNVTFDVADVLGKGNYGTTVYKGKFGELDIAVKRISIIDSDQLACTRAVHEINVLKLCDRHENIVRYFGSRKSDNDFLIMLEICDMTLAKWVKEKSIEAHPIEVLRQTTVGLGWLHDHRIIHRDLKPENILFTRNPMRIKIADFGLSRRMNDDRSVVSTSCMGGTKGWVAPEILNQTLQGNSRHCEFTFASDIFALGCVYYFIMTDGKHAFGDHIRREGNILDGKLVIDEMDIVHGCLKNVLFVKLLISHNPKWRPNCSVILTCPIFWDTDRHKSFILDLIGMNKGFLRTDLNQKCQRTCNLRQSKLDEMMRTLGCQQNNISLCSNNVTYLQINLPLFYESCSELYIHEITEYLGYTIQKPLNSTAVASGTLNTNNVENNPKPTEESTGQTIKGKESDQSERESKPEPKENKENEILSQQLQLASKTNYFQKSKKLANDLTSKEDQINISEDDLNQETDSSEEDDEDNMSDTPIWAAIAEKALQLVTFSEPKHNSKAPFEIILNEDNLRKILEPTKDNPICILGIAGPPNNGKSLLLNYVRLELEAMENINTDFNITKIDHPVDGFHWCTKLNPNTKGIWVWHRPFFIEADGNDIAVILLDSQGLDDERMTSEQISSIFGLGFLYSSILLYNLTNDITANDLERLTKYLLYGKLFQETGKECTKEPPFQKISFLVRDWNSSKLNYGEVDAKALLNQKLEKYNKITSNEFSKCFREVKSYLMPSIDQTALAQDQDFKGQTVGLNLEFLEHLSAYITGILKKLLVVRGLGNDVTAPEFSTYAIQFVNLFNSTLEENRLPTDDELCQVRCEAYHETIIKTTLQKFQKTFQNRSKNLEYLTEVELKQIKEIGTAQATSMYNKADKLAEYAPDNRRKLEQQLENYYESFKQENTDSRTTYVSKCINIANEEYKTQLYETFPFDENKITIYEDDDIQALSKTVGERVTLAFNSKFTKEEMETRQILTNSLEEVLNSSLQTYLETNNLNKNMANVVLTQLTSEVIRTYETTMQTFMSNFPFFETPLLNQSHSWNLKIAINRFEHAEKPDDPQIVNQHREHVHKKLEKMYNFFNEIQIEKMNTKMKVGIDLLNEQLKALKIDLRKKVEEGSSAQELQDYYEIKAKSITHQFKQLNPFPENASQHEILKTKLQGQLQLVFHTVRQEELDTKRKLEDKLKGEYYRCFELYTKAMNTFKIGEFFDKKKLLKSNETNSNNAISSFDEKTKLIDDLERVNVHRKQLTTAIEEVFQKLKTENNAAVKLAKSEAKNLKTDCLKHYSDVMREAVASCETNEAFTAEHEKVKFEVIESFNVKWSAAYKSKEFLEEFMQDLEDYMEVQFPELLEVFQAYKKTDNEKTNSVKKEAYVYYHEEMETHMKNNHFIELQLLRKMHNQAAQTALKRCTNANSLKETQLTILKQSFEKSYKKYKGKIIMMLNYEFGSEPAVGIDLGTTYCCAAVFFRGRTIVIRNEQGRNTASYVCINPDGTHTVGNPAKENAFRQPQNTVYDSKRVLGRSFQDEELQNYIHFWPFAVVDGEDGITIQIGQKQYYPEQISSILLMNLVKQAEEMIGVTIRQAVLTVPAYFTNRQREATQNAAEMAGLELLQILNEPIAAALAYNFERFREEVRKVLIFDLGGGTFDISILEMDGCNIRILGIDGDSHLGGDDFDKAMAEYCSNEFKKQHGFDPFEGNYSMRRTEVYAARQRFSRLKLYCERGKIDLSITIQTVISIDAFFEEKDLKVKVTRSKFEELNAPYFQKTLDIVERSLNQVGWAKAEIDDIVLVGGSTHIPKVQHMLSDYFGGKALNHTIHPEEAVAYGAAVQAALLNGGNAKANQ